MVEKRGLHSPEQGDSTSNIVETVEGTSLLSLDEQIAPAPAPSPEVHVEAQPIQPIVATPQAETPSQPEVAAPIVSPDILTEVPTDAAGVLAAQSAMAAIFEQGVDR